MNANKSIKSICFITDVLIVGGVEKVLIDCLTYMQHADWYKENNVAISVYVLDHAEKKVLDMLPPNANVVECHLANSPIKTKLMNMPYISRFFYNRIFKGKSFDCVISLKPEYLCAAYSPLFGKTIHWYHADSYLKYGDRSEMRIADRIKKRILKSGLKKNDMVWAVSPSIAQTMQDIFSIHNVHALPNPINCADILEKSNESCDVVFDETCFNIVCIGRFSHEKGFDRVIRMFSDERVKASDIHVYFIGDGVGKNRLTALAEQYEATDKIRFLGKKTNPYPYLKQASLLVCPSRNESFGLTLFEAMVLGVPVISTATLGGMYSTQNGTVACMIDNSDSSEELTERILSLVSSRSNYTHSLETAKEWAEKHDVSQFGERFHALLTDGF